METVLTVEELEEMYKLGEPMILHLWHKDVQVGDKAICGATKKNPWIGGKIPENAVKCPKCLEFQKKVFGVEG